MMADHRYSHILFKGRRSSLAIAARGTAVLRSLD